MTFGENCIENSCCKFETTIPYVNTTSQNSNCSDHSALRTSSPSISSDPEYPSFKTASQVIASQLIMLAQQPENQCFALSLRDIELISEPSMERLPTVQLCGITKTIPKNADPKHYLPCQYYDFLDVFNRKQANTLPPHRPWDHTIGLQPENQPPAARPYSMNLHELKSLREYLDKELDKDLIRVSRSPAAAPVLFVKKPNGDLRFCIDYRGVNAITAKNRHSLPLISETLGQLS